MTEVLVVEDDTAVRKLLVDTLAVEGFGVAVASSAEGAIALLDEGGVDVALLDLRLPRPTGWRVLDACALRPDWPPVVVVTARAEASALPALAMGAVDVLAKPFDPLAVADLVATLATSSSEALAEHRVAARSRCAV